jgi:hypothetical protein
MQKKKNQLKIVDNEDFFVIYILDLYWKKNDN